MDASASQQRPSITSVGSSTSNSSFSSARSSITKVKKKKTKTFRPGFGRQLSDESVAALQRGDLTEDDVIQHTGADDGVEKRAAPKIATNPTDLAHLLPPVKSGSVLAGLTVHGGSAASNGSVLAGLTVHTADGNSANSQDDEDTSATTTNGGGILAGLHVQSQSSHNAGASTSVVLPTARTSSKQKPTPPEPVKPAPPATPEERLLSTLRDFHESVLSFRDSTSKQNEEENAILERKTQLAKQLTQYEIDLRDIEAQQQQACEAEDFEKADALNGAINSVRHCITLTESDLRKADNELAAFLKAKEKAFANQLKSTRGTLKELEKFREDQDNERAALREELKKFEHEQTDHLQFEAERIETELHHVSTNLDHLQSEKSEIDSTIEEQCKDEITLREELLEKRAGVEEEIRELERQLKLKMDEMRGIQSSIDKADHEIEAVRSKYSRQLKRIADREEGLLKTKAEVEADAEQLKQEKVQFGEKIEDYEARISEYGKRMTTVKKEMRAAMLLVSVLEVQETRREQSAVRKKQHTAELTALSDAATIAEQSYVMLQKQHNELEKSLSVHRNAIASAEAMIPQLEQEKKNAAAQRNFKEAARISKDIKSLEKDQATAEEMVEVVEMELQDLKERIVKREAECEDKKEELKTVERQLELNALQELWKEAKLLRKSIRRIERIKTESLAAADGVDFRSSALLLVQAEYDACMSQADVLQAKHGVEDPSQDEEIEDDEEVEDDDSLDEDEVERMTETSAQVVGEPDSSVSEAVENDIGDGPAALEEISAKLTELEDMIEKATENEDYELAAKLDEKIDTLKRRQQSIHAMIQADAMGPSGPSEASINHDVGDSVEHAAPSEAEATRETQPRLSERFNHEDLDNELKLLRARITMLEADIERATENEDYDTAAHLDDEVSKLREEENEILEALANKPEHSNDDALEAPQEMHVEAEGDPSTPANSEAALMFDGLQVSEVSSEVVVDSSVSTSSVSMFAGLQVGGDPVVEVEGSSPAAQAAILSPLRVNSPRRLSIGSGPNSPRRMSSSSVASVKSPNVANATPSEVAQVETSTDAAQSIFGGLSMSDPGVVEEANSASSLVDVELVSEAAELVCIAETSSELEQETVESAVASSMFEGLMIGSPTTMTAEENTGENAPEKKEDESAVATASMFEGLMIGAPATMTAEADTDENVPEKEKEEGEIADGSTSSMFAGLMLGTQASNELATPQSVDDPRYPSSQHL
ncbi:hypothetical protein PINS_up005779 [Pythium insidiosum]|nr:hypothetical protein PINS_up005779 [Pythium insidiosum]